MSKNAGEPGTLRRLAGQWAAQIAWSLEAIVGAILMLVSKILANTGGGRPHETQAWRMPQVPARLWWPMVSKPQAMVAARGFFVHDRQAAASGRKVCAVRRGDSNGRPGALGRRSLFMTVGPFSIIQFGSGDSRYSREQHVAT